MPDSVRELVDSRLRDLRLSYAEASKRIGKSHSYIQQFLKRNVPQELAEDERDALAQLLQVSPDDLRATPRGGVRQHTEISRRQSLPNQISSRKLPVLGMAEGGPDGAYDWNGQVVEYVDPPPFLAEAVDAYAVYVTGTSMSPRYEPGELLYIHPGRPVTPGCYVLVQMKPETDGVAPRAFLKRLERRTATKLILAQLHPARTIEIPADRVHSVHRIVGSGEG